MSCFKHDWCCWVSTQLRVPVVHKGVFMTTETELLVTRQERLCRKCGRAEVDMTAYDPWVGKER